MSIAQNLGASGEPCISLGRVRLVGRAMLAPMAGVTDVGMRRIASPRGATLTFSEMVASGTFLGGDDESRLRAEGEGVSPNAVQLVGHAPTAMAGTARRVEAAGAEIIDINMGCPAKRVAGALAGSALMRDLDSAFRIIEAVVCTVRTPVTLKTRLGWGGDAPKGPEPRGGGGGGGGRDGAVHGRTRCQF